MKSEAEKHGAVLYAAGEFVASLKEVHACKNQKYYLSLIEQARTKAALILDVDEWVKK
jgi:hypothetical protein